MKHNSVRTTTDPGAAYGRQGAADARFIDEFGAVPQKIVLGNGQDDPGLFLTAINDNLNDQRNITWNERGNGGKSTAQRRATTRPDEPRRQGEGDHRLRASKKLLPQS